MTSPKMFSFWALLAIVGIAAFFTYQVMSIFLVPMFLAAILVVIFRPVHDWMLEKLKGRNALAAGATTLAILLIVLVPLIGIFSMAIKETIDLVRSDDQPKVEVRLDRLRNRMGLTIPNPPLYHQIVEELDNLIETPPTGRSADAATALITQLRTDLDKYREDLGEATVQEIEFNRGSDLENRDQLIADARAGNIEPVAAVVSGAMTFPTLSGDVIQRWRGMLEGIDIANAQLGEIVDAVQKEQLTPGDLIFSSRMEDVRSSLRRQMVAYLGGQPMATLRLYANPGDSEASRLQAVAIDRLETYVLPVTGAGAKFLGSLVLGLGILILSLYYFFYDGPALISAAMRLSPLEDEYERQLIEEFSTVSRAVVLATLLSALAQGILAGIGFWFCGLESVFLLMFLTMTLAMVPFLGAASVWVPVSIWLIVAEEKIAAGVGLAIYGVAVISLVDNIIKPFVLHGQSKLHPLLALLSVLGGVSALGPIGILVGPMLVAFMQVLLNMLRGELVKMAEAESSSETNLRKSS
ncbi:AI-2E family transporter [Blastopirellula sp. JC732]|uniref:AI-2E family transporter n=1 Tax=Blastopirellula sediminis TaxID=2894196 RepID=A0A9X1SFU2_9BACT|nr:AI-2E family transporter [Blastopirellula sediminis]MCC9609086.1 AI-2E family transporter [Blastopirellula sediminis]MCC9628137.1 AI-2E family transporter [Blastopirellula sediminis]